MARRSFAEAAWPSLCLLCLLVCVYYIHATNGVTAQSKILDEIISTKNYVIIMEDEQNSVDNYIPELQDIITPFGSQLKGIYKRSFAYKTIHERLVQILSRVIESLGKEEPGIVQKYGKSSAAELSQVIANINKLKNEISTNAPIVPLVPNHNGSNAKRIKVWNDYLVERTNLDGNVPRWYNTAWIYCECYMYQRLTEAFAHSKTLQSYDPFANQKIQAFEGSIASIAAVANHTLKHINRGQEISLADLKKEFSVFVRLGLWGNRCDLSLSAGVANGQVGNPVNLLQSLESDILVDNTDFIWNCMSKARPTNGSKTIDIVLDNAGYELFTDLCLAAFLVGNNVAQKIRFYVKQVPWYISDVTTPDFHWMVTRMRESSDLKLTELGELINGYLTTGVWTIEEEQFWTDPFVYSQMAEKNPVLYAKLSEASFILFKGDLNYRKLVGDINWEYSTTFLQAIQGFVPANLASLRTVKSDVCVGLKPQQGESIRNKDANWMETGQYGLIQATIDTCPCE